MFLAALIGFLTTFVGAFAATGIPNPLGSNDLNVIVQRAAKQIAAIAAPLTVIMVLVAGLLYMTGGGSPERITRAHKTLIWAIVGFAVTLFSTVVYALITNLLGTK